MGEVEAEAAEVEVEVPAATGKEGRADAISAEI